MITPTPEKAPPTIPMDYNWARELKLIRKPANFMTTISDERGEELLYAGMPISDVFKVRPIIYFNAFRVYSSYRMILGLVGCLVCCGFKEGSYTYKMIIISHSY